MAFEEFVKNKPMSDPEARKAEDLVRKKGRRKPAIAPSRKSVNAKLVRFTSVAIQTLIIVGILAAVAFLGYQGFLIYINN